MHTRTRITRCTSPSPAIPTPFLLLSLTLDRCLDVLFRFSRLLASRVPCSRSVFLRCLKPRAGRSCYNPELADGRPMYGSLFYAACIALWCTTRERVQARPVAFFGRNAISSILDPQLLLMRDELRTYVIVTRRVAITRRYVVKYSMID